MKNIIKIMKHFVDKKFPRKELRYIYYDGDEHKLVATDTIRMLIIEKDLGDESFYIDVYKLNELKDAVKVIDGFNCYNNKELKFVPYKKAIPEYKKFVHIKELTNLADVIINLGNLITDEKIFISWSKKYDALDLEAEDIKIFYENKKKPIIIKGLINTSKKITKKEMYYCTLVIAPSIF